MNAEKLPRSLYLAVVWGRSQTALPASSRDRSPRLAPSNRPDLHRLRCAVRAARAPDPRNRQVGRCAAPREYPTRPDRPLVAHRPLVRRKPGLRRCSSSCSCRSSWVCRSGSLTTGSPTSSTCWLPARWLRSCGPSSRRSGPTPSFADQHARTGASDLGRGAVLIDLQPKRCPACRTSIRHHPLASFFVLAYAASWELLWMPLVVSGDGSPTGLGLGPIAPGIPGAFDGGDPARRRGTRQSRGTEAARPASSLASRRRLVGGGSAAFGSPGRCRRLEGPVRRRLSGCHRDTPWGRVPVDLLHRPGQCGGRGDRLAWICSAASASCPQRPRC